MEYACKDYTDELDEHGIRSSMSRRGNVFDNAMAESFIKTLKYEEVYRMEYRDLAEAKASIKEFLEKIYIFTHSSRQLFADIPLGLKEMFQ